MLRQHTHPHHASNKVTSYSIILQFKAFIIDSIQLTYTIRGAELRSVCVLAAVVRLVNTQHQVEVWSRTTKVYIGCESETQNKTYYKRMYVPRELFGHTWHHARVHSKYWRKLANNTHGRQYSERIIYVNQIIDGRDRKHLEHVRWLYMCVRVCLRWCRAIRHAFRGITHNVERHAMCVCV